MNSVYTGGGEISEVLVVTMPDLPSAPTAVVAAVGDSQVSLAFTAGSDNGSDISRYEYSIDEGEWTAVSPVVVASPLVIAGLTNGVSYSVRIRAVNAVGEGAASEAVTFIPLTVPSVVTDVVPTPGDGRVSIAFSVPADSGGSAITNFEYKVDDGSWVALSPAVTVGPIVVTGLTNGVSYSVQIRAVNAVGDGVASEAVTFTLAEIEVPSVSTETPAPVESVVLELPTSPTPLIPDTTLSLGEPVTLEFGGFVPGEFVQLIVASTPRIISSGYADSEGKIRLSGSLPTDLAAGEHSLALYAPESGRGVRQPITIEVSLLPATGTSPFDEVMVMLMLIIVGSCLLVVSRNRRMPRNLQHS
jgi:predicted RNA-binding protein with TRAM domain